MPFLKKIDQQSKIKQASPPRPLSLTVARTIERFDQIKPPVDNIHIAKIEVHDTVSQVAWFYEKLRNAIDYQDEHLLRKNAIERILKRRLTTGVSAQDVAEPLIPELIRGGYLPNKEIPVTVITDATDIINAYIHLWTKVPTLDDKRRMEKLFDWYVGLVASHLNELVAPTAREEILAELMYTTIHRDITFAAGELHEHEKNTQLYVAIHRALLKSDSNIIRYKLFVREHPEWLQPTPDIVERLGRHLPDIKDHVEYELFHPAGDILQRLMKKYAIIFLVFDDVEKEFGADALAKMTQPDNLVEIIKKAYNDRRKRVTRKIARSVVRSIIYVFITKMLLTLLLEVPAEKLLSGTAAIDLPRLLFLILFPPFLLLFIGVSIRPPGKNNETSVVEKVEALVYQGDERHTLVKPRKPIRRSSAFIYFYRILYALTFFVVFGLVISGLAMFRYTPVSITVFLLFLTIVSFFGIRVRYLAKELLVVDQREGILTVLFDFFSVPILQVGRWISMRAPKINLLIFFFDVIVESPFKAFLEVTEGFFGFLREKREEIY